MKKIVIYLLAFSIVWALVAGSCYLLSIIFGLNLFDDWKEYVIIGFAGAMAGVFGPLLSDGLYKLFKKK